MAAVQVQTIPNFELIQSKFVRISIKQCFCADDNFDFESQMAEKQHPHIVE